GAGGAGRPLSAVDQDNGINYALSASYAPHGELSSLLLGQSDTFSGINLNQGYNSRLQPTSIRGWSVSSGVVLDLGYCFYGVSNGSCPSSGINNGNVTQITNNIDSSRSQSFSYDQLNRLLTAQSTANHSNAGPAGCWAESYTVDPWGN